MNSISFTDKTTGQTYWANSTNEVIKLINNDCVIDDYKKDQVMEYINNGYSFEFYSDALFDDIFYFDIPEWLKEKENYHKFKEYYDMNHDDMNHDDMNHDDMEELIQNGFSLDESVELLENSITFDDIPEWLLKRISDANDIIEWIEWIEKNGDESLAEAAFYLDIEPSKIRDKFVCEDSDKENYARQFYEDCYGKIPNFLDFHIDWEGVANDIMQDYTEQDGYWFNLNA